MDWYTRRPASSTTRPGGGQGGSDKGDGKKRAMSLPDFAVADVFGEVVRSVHHGIPDASMVVDVRMTFSSVHVSKGGVPIFAPRTAQQGIEVVLTTQVRGGGDKSGDAGGTRRGV